MPIQRLRACSACCLLAVVLPAAIPSCITTERVTFGLSRPVFVTHAPEDNNHLYIVEQAGRIKVLNLTNGQISIFLDLTSLVQSTGNEQGLLGLVFHNDYARPENGYFYVNYTAKPDGATKVVEYKRMAGNSLQGDPNSARLLLRVPQPQTNHNGGWLGTRADDLLYIALGDGGGGNDDGTGHTIGVGNAQDIDQNLLGKILRINPNPAADDFPGDPDRNYTIPPTNPFVGIPGDDEIWSYGLRNPWRCSFDRLTGDFWIADVGQDSREEINFRPANSPGGENYGWRLREGSIQTPTPGIGGPPPPGNVNPLYDYAHGSGQFEGSSVTGGYVYRGPIAELQGKYFFGDYVNQKVWSLTRSGSTYSELTDWTAKFQPDAGAINGIASFGEDSVGNLYIVDLDGEIFRVVKMNPLAKAARSVASAVTQTVPRMTGRR